MKLSLCMIVKNEAEVLKKTLPELAQAVDEIIVVDTGSTDETIECAKRHGAKVYNFPWINDFSAARNESLKYATGDWIIWIDADESISAQSIKVLKTAIAESKEDAFCLPIYESKYGQQEEGIFYFRIKAFRNGFGFHFERPFNEQVYDKDGSLLSTQSYLPNAKIFHWGRDLGKDKLQAKKERNFKILAESIKTKPNDPHYHFLLANNYYDIKNMEMSVIEYKKVVELEPNSIIAADSMIMIAKIFIDQSKYSDAYDYLKPAAKIEPNNAEIYNLIGVIYISIEDYDKAIQVLEHSIKLNPSQNISNFNKPSEYGFTPRFLLGNVNILAGNTAKALYWFESAYGYSPSKGLKEKIDNMNRALRG